VNDYVVRSGDDDAGALSILILGAKAAGQDPSSFGPSHVDLVQRLLASQQSDGLFGKSDPATTFDGSFRQGLALLALHTVGMSNAKGVAFLVDQQCANGLWENFRPDTSVPCDPADPVTFSGPDTNGTAVDMLGLFAQGDTTHAKAAATALDTLRTNGGWGFTAVANNPNGPDANSTGLVLAALRTVNGSVDAKGLNALLAFQVGCTADPADRGGIAFQPGKGGTLAPDALATDQALLGLSEATFPLGTPQVASTVPDVCATTTGSTVAASAASTTTTTTAAAHTSVDAASAGELPRTGSSTEALFLVGVGFVAIGAVLVRRRA
jgi:LPXTG-motif cell wall-anchored protein